jgi:DNA polymerase
MSDLLFADDETRSDIDLKTCGSYVYFESPNTDVLIVRYALDDGPIGTWLRGMPCPPEVRAHIEAGGKVSGWNVFGFERLAFDAVLGPRYGWPVPRLDQYDDTMHAAAAMSLPRSLGSAAEVLDLPVKKDKEGIRLIRKFSMPRKPRKDEPPGLYWNEPEDHPEDFAKFVSYCGDDVAVERLAKRRLVPLSDFERRVAVLDAKINSSGVRIDTRSARAALVIADKAKRGMDQEMRAITGGAVPACSQPGKLIEWVQGQGVVLNSAAKAEITDLLAADDLPAHVRKALEVRQEAAKTSVSKLQAMLNRSSPDSRVRGGFMYHGASTGRWISTGVNLANLPRPRKLYEDAHLRTDTLFQAFRSEDPDVLRYLYEGDLGRPLHLISDAIRGFIWAAPGRDLVQADYSNIEGNVVAWLAGEEWKLEAIRELIADPSLPDMYRRTAAAILGLPVEEVTKKHWARQAVGKPAELGLSYGGGVMAFVTFARGYGVNLEGLAPAILAQADEERLAKAAKRYESEMQRGRSGTTILSKDAWIACEVVKLGWRAANSAITRSWRDLETAVREAVQNPGSITEAARTRYRVAQGFLWAQLPSGRCLAYGSPRLKDQVWARIELPDGTWADSEVMDRDAAEAGERRGTVKIEGTTSAKVTVLGVNAVTKKWERYALYGGIICENNTQATARDILVNGMLKADSAGYEIIAHVYDEILTEVPKGFGSVAEFERLICELPAWAEGLPLTASGWRGKRYRKD